MFNSTLEFGGELSATVIRANGSLEDQGILSTSKIPLKEAVKRVKASMKCWDRLYAECKEYLPLVVSGSALAYAITHGSLPAAQLALVTTAGINYLAADFLASSSNHIGAFSYVDCGTGTTAAAIGDTALQTPYGGARTAGTQSTPVAGQYKVVGLVTFSGTLAITEMGIFSAAAAGTLWDHRVFAAINVNSGDSIQFSYTVTCTAGGS